MYSTNVCFKSNNNSDIHKNRQTSTTTNVTIPTSDTVLDLSTLGHDDNMKLRRALILLMEEILPDWNDVNEKNIQLERVGGAFTNCIYFVTSNSRKVVLRVYGNGVDQLCDRDRELDFVEKLSTLNIGPKLLGIFTNGRFEEYLESKTLSNKDLHQPQISRLVAERLSQLHNIINIFPPSTASEPQVWTNIYNWYSLALEIDFSEEQEEELKEIGFKSLKDDIDELKDKLNFDSSIVFAHNDTQYGNILQLTGTDQLVMVDFEYSGYNYRQFDLANFFCEWMFNYHSKEPHKMNLDKYPDEGQQINVLQSYIESYIEKDPTFKVDIRRLQLEVNSFTLASHVMWGIWGLIQSSQSEIDFDYFGYAMQRLRHFKNVKDEVYKNLLNQV